MYSLFTENMHVNVGPLHPYYIYECSIAAYTIAVGVFSSPINITTHEAGKVDLYYTFSSVYVHYTLHIVIQIVS